MTKTLIRIFSFQDFTTSENRFVGTFCLCRIAQGDMSSAQFLEFLLAATRLIWVDLASDCSVGLAHLLVRGIPGDRHMATESLREGTNQRHESALERVALGRHPDGGESQNYGPNGVKVMGEYLTQEWDDKAGRDN